MRYLVVGAGALGGYFGGRLLEAGRDVTFLLRPARAQALARTGLVIKSRFGDAVLPSPPSVLKENLATPFDVVVLACKAYDLAETMAAFAPAAAPSRESNRRTVCPACAATCAIPAPMMPAPTTSTGVSCPRSMLIRPV